MIGYYVSMVTKQCRNKSVHLPGTNWAPTINLTMNHIYFKVTNRESANKVTLFRTVDILKRFSSGTI
ncbi:hypothetical protein V1477_005403 [Vespula maculifrons]|uniref:Uncharacterized protein n=1 Tax=Vespula maculifrons TaxID=7453 RepID=A0ABD2CS74_VESMC